MEQTRLDVGNGSPHLAPRVTRDTLPHGSLPRRKMNERIRRSGVEHARQHIQNHEHTIRRGMPNQSASTNQRGSCGRRTDASSRPMPASSAAGVITDPNNERKRPVARAAVRSNDRGHSPASAILTLAATQGNTAARAPMSTIETVHTSSPDHHGLQKHAFELHVIGHRRDVNAVT
jgi:hypothetical protein